MTAVFEAVVFWVEGTRLKHILHVHFVVVFLMDGVYKNF